MNFVFFSIFQVLFVDYGNIEECEFGDLCRELIFTDLPIMAKRCRLINIEPDGAKWSPDARAFCMNELLNSKCQIKLHGRCDSNGILPCSLTTMKGDDMNSLLISKGYARPKNPSMSHSSGSDDKPISKFEFNPDDFCDVADYKEMFELNKLTVNNEFDELNASKHEVYREPDMDILDFDNFSVSASTSNADDENLSDTIIDRIGSSFEQFHLNKCTRHFRCEIVMILDPLYVAIAPESPEYSLKYNRMMLSLQKTAPCLQKLNAIDENCKCIAFSREEKLWKRAMIIEAKSDSTNEITIVFVDNLHIATINAADIREFPTDDYFMLPLKYKEAQLFGLKPNRRLRPQDVTDMLRKVLNQTKDQFYIKIISMVSKPQIEIYTSRHMQEVIYTSLITDGFYSKINSIPM